MLSRWASSQDSSRSRSDNLQRKLINPPVHHLVPPRKAGWQQQSIEKPDSKQHAQLTELEKQMGLQGVEICLGRAVNRATLGVSQHKNPWLTQLCSAQNFRQA